MLSRRNGSVRLLELGRQAMAYMHVVPFQVPPYALPYPAIHVCVCLLACPLATVPNSSLEVERLDPASQTSLVQSTHLRTKCVVI